MKVDLIAGARPNFMKIAPITHAIKAAQEQGKSISYRLIHTGQHYDKNMSDAFFEELQISHPDFNLGAGGGSQAEQLGKIGVAYEKLLMVEGKPDICMVVGDVTSTMACSISAQKLGVRVAHVEGGIRSGDWSMPEEINRIVTDSISDYFFTTSQKANKNLKASGVKDEQIFYVGNTMIDTLLAKMPEFRQPDFWKEKGLKPQGYLVMTLHRPANVDKEIELKNLIDEIIRTSEDYKLIFPVHPRTRKILDKLGQFDDRLIMVDPLGYLEFNYLVKNSKAVITDSGGITEETTVMQIPCITLRDNTERPETVEIGTNDLIGTNPKAVAPAMERLLSGNWKKGSIPELWDGKTAPRIVNHLLDLDN